MTKEPEIDLQSFLLALVLFVPSCAWAAFVYAKLWAWIISPVTGLRTIGMLEALAFSLVAAVMTFNVDSAYYAKDYEGKSPTERVLVKFFARALALGLGLLMGLAWKAILF